jgi:hypothetical protein
MVAPKGRRLILAVCFTLDFAIPAFAGCVTAAGVSVPARAGPAIRVVAMRAAAIFRNIEVVLVSSPVGPELVVGRPYLPIPMTILTLR